MDNHISPIIQAAYQSMQSAMPDHHLSPYFRIRIYDVLEKNLEPELARLVRGYMAVSAAKKVLPIFTNFSIRISPKLRCDCAISINIAERILKNRISADSWWVRRRSETLHNLIGGVFFGIPEDEFEINARRAAQAARKALLEACGLRLMNNLGKISVFDELGRKQVSGLGLTDEQLVSGGQGDTAACAAIAWSCSAFSSKCDSEKLFSFWNWWLLEAIPKAYSHASEQLRK